MIKKYKKKPVIEAVQYTKNNLKECLDFSGYIAHNIKIDGQKTGAFYLAIKTLEGTMRADLGDYIIKGVKGEFYPCKPDIFESSYEEVF